MCCGCGCGCCCVLLWLVVLLLFLSLHSTSCACPHQWRVNWHTVKAGPNTWDDSQFRRHWDLTANWTEFKMLHDAAKNQPMRRVAPGDSSTPVLDDQERALRVSCVFVCVVCAVCCVLCVVVAVVAVVARRNLTDAQCVCPHTRRCDATLSLKTNLHVAGHLGVRLQASPPPPALDDTQYKLRVIEGSKKITLKNSKVPQMCCFSKTAEKTC